MPKIDQHFEFKNYAVYAHTYSGSLSWIAQFLVQIILFHSGPRDRKNYEKNQKKCKIKNSWNRNTLKIAHNPIFLDGNAFKKMCFRWFLLSI